MSDRENLRRVLAENDVGRWDASLHGWRCEYPDRYGPCGCVDELLDDLAPLLAEAERRGAERAWDEGWGAAGEAFFAGMAAEAEGRECPPSGDGPPNPYRAGDDQ